MPAAGVEMGMDILQSRDMPAAARADVAGGSAMALLRAVAVALGIGWSILFVVVGLHYDLQMYGDGSIFSYGVAVQDAWAFHLHNMPGRLFVYLFSFVPAEAYVGLTGDARGGIAAYGFLFYAAPLLGLAATWAADRSRGRIIFAYACTSTACSAPLVFGFPTEMWMAHALFWPALAVCHYARPGLGGIAPVFVVLLALAFTHEGAIVLEVAILATLALRGLRDPALWRAAGAFLVVMTFWSAVKAALPPDDYYAGVFTAAALHFFDPDRFVNGFFLSLAGALVAYGILFLCLRRFAPATAQLGAAAVVAAALIVYWLWFDQSLHTYHRYFFRTVLLIATLGFGGLAALYALDADGRLRVPFLRPLMAALAADTMARAAVGAIALVTLVHAVETAKFAVAWTQYKGAIQALATGTASDPALGDARFVSSDRAGVNPLSWNSTTPYLSVLLAPGFAPSRLVVNPRANYFWLSCAVATAKQQAERAVPSASRALVRRYACLHR
jgi:hypothetical protein